MSLNRARREEVYSRVEHRRDRLGSRFQGAAATVIQKARDPGQIKRKATVDGLGRLASVTEDPDSGSLVTSYAYDVNDNLKTVTQGSQTRDFTYDALGRLKTAHNRETGLLTFTYDANSNLLSRTAGGVLTCFGVVSGGVCLQTQPGYDGWNRPLRKQYSLGQALEVNCYDGRVATGATSNHEA